MSFFKGFKRAKAIKTVALGTVSTLLFFWAAIRYWGADPEELKQYLFATLLMIAITMIAGAVVGFIISRIRR